MRDDVGDEVAGLDLFGERAATATCSMRPPPASSMIVSRHVDHARADADPTL